MLPLVNSTTLILIVAFECGSLTPHEMKAGLSLAHASVTNGYIFEKENVVLEIKRFSFT